MRVFRNDQAVISPAFCITHGLLHSDITPVLSPGDYIINQKPVLGMRVSPRCLVMVWKAQDFVNNKQFMDGTFSAGANHCCCICLFHDAL